MSEENTQQLEVMDGGQALTSIISGEINSQIATAKRYPRRISEVRDRVLTLATIDEDTAQSCFYAKPVGAKTITGESVRLAEILVASYQNIRAAWRPISIDRVNGSVTCQGVCMDLENNASTSLEKTHQVQRLKKTGEFAEFMINNAVNACGAIAYRDAVFKVVPKAIIKSLLPEIKKAAQGSGTLDQKVDRCISRLIEVCKEQGYKKTDLEKRILGVVGASKRTDIDLAKLDLLIGIGTAIRDGEIRVEDALSGGDNKAAIPNAFEKPEEPQEATETPNEEES